jgi:hypothetical protein
VWVLPGTHRAPVEVPLRATLPTTTELGIECTGGALLWDGYASFGLTLPSPDAESFGVERLFAQGAAVPISAVVSVNSQGSVALVSMRSTSWPEGHYALTITAGQGAQVVPFCVSSPVRDVDYPVVAFVPSAADTAAARNAMHDQAQP